MMLDFKNVMFIYILFLLTDSMRIVVGTWALD